MSKLIELSGRHFGSWLVISYAGLNELGQPCWKCLCNCGTERQVVGQTLRAGTSVSCGCTKPAAIAKARTIHGHSANGQESREYSAWKAMHRRCNPNNKSTFKWYGKYGISVCKRWDSFENFLVDMGKCPEGLTLDRINCDQDYKPSNCRWASWSVQRLNQRRNK